MAVEDVPLDWAAQSENLPLYLFMGLYLAIILGVGFVAHRWKQEAAAQGAVQAQFAGKFNAPLVIMTTFSSVFSGYTVIGVPEEASKAGYTSIKWVPAIFSIAFGMLIFHPRLRKLAKDRKYDSPNDFLADRYRSRMVTFLGSSCACLPQLFYLTVQLVSFAELLNGVTAGLVPKVWGMLFFALLVLLMEKVGGMNSVVLSDAVQAAFMIFGFLAIVLLVVAKYGTLFDLAARDCPSLGYVNLTQKAELLILSEQDSSLLDQAPALCTNPPPEPGPNETSECKAFGCILAARPDFNDAPSYRTQAGMLWFIFNFLMFPLNPHMVQRASIAPSDKALRLTIGVLVFAAFLTMLPGIFAGLVTATFRDSWPNSSDGASALNAINNQLKNEGILQYSIVAILTCSALAAIMSTADSVILGVSNALSIDIFRGILKPNASQEAIVWFGTFVSIALTGLAYVGGLRITSDNFSTLLTLQNGVLFQLGPAFLLGLYSSISETAVAAGILAGLVVLSSLTTLNVLSQTPELGLDIETPQELMTFLSYVPVPNCAALVNFVITGLVQAIMASRGKGNGNLGKALGRYADAVNMRFGYQVTPDNIKVLMAKDVEPGNVLKACSLLYILLAVPFYAIWVPNDELVYGVPEWCLVTFFITLVAAVLLLCLVCSWRPTEEPPLLEETEMPEGTPAGALQAEG